MLLIPSLLFVLGIVLLYFGAEMLVRGSSTLAIRFGIRPMIVGLTIVAMGTSAPELSVSLIAAIRQTKDIALGNIIGSNIANLALVVGVAALIRPLEIQVSTVRREMPFLILATALFFIMSVDGTLGHVDGAILLLLFVGFIFYMIRSAQKDRMGAKHFQAGLPAPEEKKQRNWLSIVLTLAGLVLLVGASSLIVRSATIIALALGISELVIGVTMVAVGTSLPELAISTVSVAKGEVDIAVGNAVGSNIFNTLMVIAIIGLLFPIQVDKPLLTFHFPFQMILTIIFLPLIRTGFKIQRWEGGVLVGSYVLFIYLLLVMDFI